MRIIGGEFRGRTLSAVPADRVRPTADPVREALFNLLGQELKGKSFVDIASGTGAVGLEAYSRGARPVVMVEKDRTALLTIRRNIERLETSGEVLQGIIVVADDAHRWLRLGAHRVVPRIDIAFLDPPYGFPRLGRWLEALAESGCLQTGGLVVVEHRASDPMPTGPLSLRWTRRYGDTSLTALGPA